jgi:Creatinase/Prolidase N-terminal domain
MRPAPGLDIDARLRQIDVERMRHERLARFRTELAKLDVAGALLCDPINIRYATDARNMAVWSMHSVARYAFVPTQGSVVLFEMGSTQHVAKGLSTIGEIRPSTPWNYMIAMDRIEEKCARWADEIVDLVRTHGAGSRRLAVDRCEPLGVRFLTDRGLTILDAQQPIEIARAIKTADEIAAMIEVLEGPQGTLFGSGAEAGVLRYITNKPRLDVTEGNVNAGYSYTAHGDPNSNVDAMINVPLIPDILAARAVVYNDRRGGYINNVPGTFTRSSTDLGIARGNGGVLPTGSVAIDNFTIAANAINPVTYQGFRFSVLGHVTDAHGPLSACITSDLSSTTTRNFSTAAYRTAHPR